MRDAILFDRNQVEHLEDLSNRPRQLSGSKLLWVDIHEGSDIGAGEVADAFALDDQTAIFLRHRVREPPSTTTAATSTSRPTRRATMRKASCMRSSASSARTGSITAHDRPIPVLEEFAERVSGSGDTGALDGPGFLAALLEWVLGSYTAAFERVEQRLEKFDVQAMRGEGADKDIELLVEMRLEVGKLRRALAAHRSALVALTHPELEALGDNASGERFQSLFTRFESTLQEARDAREAIVGSFDVLIARGGHHTNQIMKVLTLTSVILLPGALIAAVMGMNFKVGLFDNPTLFWVVIAAIIGVAPLTIGIAKLRHWI